MKLIEYVELKASEGVNLTRTDEELAKTLQADVRTVWRWVDAKKAPRHVERLLSVLVEATPERKARWFK